MRRRDVIKAIATCAAAWPLPVRAQPVKMRRVSLLLGLAENDPEASARVKAFQKTRGGYHIGMANLDRTLPPACYPPAFVSSQPDVLLWHDQPKVGCLANGGCR